MSEQFVNGTSLPGSTMTREFNFPRVVSYQCSLVTIFLKCPVVELGAWDSQIDGQIAALLDVPFVDGAQLRQIRPILIFFH